METPVSHFVAAMAEDLGLGNRPTDQRTRRLLRRLADWATAEGVPLDRDLVLDPDTVERFVAFALAGEASRATYRSVLRRVAPRLTTTAPWERPPVAIARRQLAPPYSEQEVRLLVTDAAEQPTPPRRRAARAFLALGLGAGLDGRWVSKVKADDLFWRQGALTVVVGDPAARQVVVVAAYENELSELAAEAGECFLVGGMSRSPKRTSHLTALLVVPTGHPRLLPARLRSTWLRRHLEAGTRLPELCAAAGIEGLGALSDLLDYVPLLDRRTAAAELRLTR